MSMLSARQESKQKGSNGSGCTRSLYGTVRNLTVSVGVATFLVHGDVYFWGSLMAGLFYRQHPIAILYNFFVDRFIARGEPGAIK